MAFKYKEGMSLKHLKNGQGNKRFGITGYLTQLIFKATIKILLPYNKEVNIENDSLKRENTSSVSDCQSNVLEFVRLNYFKAKSLCVFLFCWGIEFQNTKRSI